MDFTVFRQASKVRPDGTIIFKGEDALPYVGGHVLMVADGLGGAAAIRHQSFNKEMFDADKLFDVLFNGVFEEYDHMLIDYVKYSFKEFLEIKDCYFDNVNNIKKSGYFASRIVATIFLYLAEKFSNDEAFIAQRNQIFNNELITEGNDELLKQFSKFFTDNISIMLQKVSKNANLIYESAFTGLALLGTTLCATIFFEQENCVKALYFVAGDSRPYLWNETGLYQVSADQERADGGMTNFVKANGDFEVKCEYKSFKKPCVLFNASDGIFDSAKFNLSQLGLEKLLLDTIISSSTIQEVGTKFENDFIELGKHDDSSTMAFKAFGYDSFQSLQNAAKIREKSLEEQIFSRIPDILEHNYIEECLPTIDYDTICESIWKLENVNNYFTKKNMAQTEAAELPNIDANILGCKNSFAWQRSDALAILKNYTKNTDDADCFYVNMLKERATSEQIREIYTIVFMEQYNTSREDAEKIYSELLAREINLDSSPQLSIQDKNNILHCLDATIDQLKTYEAKLKRQKEITEKINDAAKGEWREVCRNCGNIFTLKSYLKAIKISDDVFEYLKKFEISESSNAFGQLQKVLLEEYDKRFYSIIEEL